MTDLKSIKLNSLYLAICVILFSCASDYNIIGTYVFDPTSSKRFFAEVPFQVDTLFLRKDSTYYSKFYGDGTYHIENNGVRGSNLVLTRKSSQFLFQIDEGANDRIKLMIVRDMNYYYRKLD